MGVLLWGRAMTTTIIILALLSVIVGLIGERMTVMRMIRRQYPGFDRDGSVYELSFTTDDRGLTWRFFGQAISVSPLTDQLQDALGDAKAGALPGSRVR